MQRDAKETVLAVVEDESDKFIKNWNAKAKGVFSDHDVALIEGIVLGIKENIRQERTRQQPDPNSLNKTIGASLFNLVEFLNVDINGSSGVRTSNSNEADKMEKIILDYLNAITKHTNVKILNRFDEEQDVPKNFQHKIDLLKKDIQEQIRKVKREGGYIGAYGEGFKDDTSRYQAKFNVLNKVNEYLNNECSLDKLQNTVDLNPKYDKGGIGRSETGKLLDRALELKGESLEPPGPRPRKR